MKYIIVQRNKIGNHVEYRVVPQGMRFDKLSDASQMLLRYVDSNFCEGTSFVIESIKVTE